MVLFPEAGKPTMRYRVFSVFIFGGWWGWVREGLDWVQFFKSIHIYSFYTLYLFEGIHLQFYIQTQNYKEKYDSILKTHE